MSEELPVITEDFIEENKQSQKKKGVSNPCECKGILCQTMPKKGGPYSKQDTYMRRNEVYRLHFEYGYSARKIADMMKINRNSINSDIQYWYSQVTKKWKSVDPTSWIIRYVERLELQKTRLREEVDKTKNVQEKISIERLILDVESRILQTQLKLLESIRLNHELATKWLNDWMKKNKHKDRYITYYDILSVSEKSKEKINKIINNDRKNELEDTKR